MSFALLFSGQGAQHPAMLPWLADDALVDGVRARLGVADWRAALADADWASRNDHAQVLLTGLALAAWGQLAPLVAMPPAAVAGYSVGELAAFAAAGVISPEAALDLAPRRAAAMDAAAATTPGGLLAVTGLSGARLERLIADTGLALAIRNGEDAVILGGPVDGLERALERATREGASCQRLPVGVASHTPWMRAAADRFAGLLADVPFRAPRVPLFSNAADRVRDAASARQALATQIATTVRWDECMDDVMARQVRCVLEIGPGQGLARLWNQRHPDVPARACDEFRSIAAVAAWLAGHAED
jgi:[acyl-carrier-protein] S-malonyltransferase